MEFYVERARLTRCDSGGIEKMPTLHERDQYYENMMLIFRARPLPKTIGFLDVFAYGGNLRLDVFNRAYTHLNLNSTPGFPLYYVYQYNSDVPKEELYELTNDILKRWCKEKVETFELKSKLDCFLEGLAYPVSLFVKGEPTKKDKVARLIYGLSLVMNLISRIIFGDFLAALPLSWSTAIHKVGMNMYTDKGLRELFSWFDKMFIVSDETGCDVVSDDIQGWEYMSREWCTRSWHAAYLDSCNATPFHRHLQTMYMLAEIKSLIVDSEGYLHDIQSYITYSGKATTHVQNSDERACLYLMDNPHTSFADASQSASTNGDDCLGVKTGLDLFSNRLGWVHTEILIQDRNQVNFCSQVFTRVGSEIFRKPDGLSKVFYAAVDNPVEESRNGVYFHVEQHPARNAFISLLKTLDLVDKPTTGGQGQ